MSKPKRFFSAKLPLFGTVAMLLLCLVSFMLPFAGRGAKLAVQEMTNNVADWLPSHFPETKDLKEFRKYFVGDQFVVVSGPWCKEGDGAYTNLRRKIFEESLDYERVLMASDDVTKQEELRAHRKGDELGLMFAGNYHEDWGDQRERWLMGKDSQWYFIDRQGRLFQWDGQNNVIEGAKRSMEKMLQGKNKANGKYIDTFGQPPNDEEGTPNPFYADPQKLCARPFKSVTSGPDVFQKMAGENGTFLIGNYGSGDAVTFEAGVEAHRRLTGALFGPTPKKSFVWTFESLLHHVDDENRQSQLQSIPVNRERFDAFIKHELDTRFDGDFDLLLKSDQGEKLELWYLMWKALDMPAPPRQTCLIVTLNEPVLKELDRVVGRPILGKARGRILELATGECGIAAANLHLGGPPTDNVAIDEEGASTLLRLVSLSALIGISLAYFAFRSIRITMMLFFVGGVSAISSLAVVWFGGSTMDAILMSMPSLVFVLGLAGAVHVVNYYKDACHEYGPELAVETAIKHAWFPCTLAAFTTALGLVSLYASSITPIKKFGLFSSIAVMGTVILLFTYLPAALTIWAPGYKKKTREEQLAEGGITALMTRMWQIVGEWVMRRWAVVCIVATLMLIVFGYGVTRVKTSVHLLKLFDPSAKILQDYRWYEEHLGKLVPAEVVVGFDLDTQREEYLKDLKAEALASGAKPETDPDTGEVVEKEIEYDRIQYALKYSMLERMELSYRIRTQLESIFGPDGLDIVGTGMSTDVFVPLHIIKSQIDSVERNVMNTKLVDKRQEMLDEQYLAIEGVASHGVTEVRDLETLPENVGRELWRVSIRLAALNNVDYGQFVNDLKSVVEPILNAYEFRTKILEAIFDDMGEAALEKSQILILGRKPAALKKRLEAEIQKRVESDHSIDNLVDQTYLFSSTLKALLENRGYRAKASRKDNPPLRVVWIDPDAVGETSAVRDPERFGKMLAESIDCLILIEDDPLFDVEFIKSKSKVFVDCRDHQFTIDPKTMIPAVGMLTAKEQRQNGADIDISAMYTGIIPIVYKAQNQLLKSLINSIGLAFVMIAIVMMLLLRDWSRPVSLTNSLNVPGGVISMLPNIFPVVLIFGAMGLSGYLVDIGSMMTASVAMGVAVDDTIHFLSWYRLGLKKGLRRKEAIRSAYARVATAMTQTTLIGGLGLFAFALSTFTPTQRFGTLMLFLLAAALVGDLIFLPALLVSPLGRFFGREIPLSELPPEAVGEDEQPELRVHSDELGDDRSPSSETKGKRRIVDGEGPPQLGSSQSG